MPNAHAFLAPSASKRWMACPPSAQRESECPSTDTAYTREGTIAHAVAELVLRHSLAQNLEYAPTYDSLALFPETFSKALLMYSEQFTSELGLPYEDFSAMVETVVNGYASIVYEDYLNAKADDPEAMLIVEAELNLKSFIPEGFGSSDAVIIADDVLRVYDLKYGKGVKVDAANNTQMMCYALGALMGPAELYSINRVFMTIIQPRLHHHSCAFSSYEDLLQWGDKVLRPAAQKAFNGEGAYNAGEHCKFCRFAPRCRALALKAEVTSKMYGLPEGLTDSELSDVLGQLEEIKSWAAKVEEYALQQVLSGRKLPGWKIVEGRSISKIKDTDAAVKALTDAGFQGEDFYKPRELKTISDLKKILRPKGFESILGQYVVKPQGKPALAPSSDPRPEFNNAEEEFKDIQL